MLRESEPKRVGEANLNRNSQLSADTLALLKEFYGEKDARQKHFEDLKTKAEDDFDKQHFSMDAFTEDWNASQFWYTDETASLLARQLLHQASDETSIAVVSAPSVFIQLKNLLASDFSDIKPEVVLLEFDKRFSVFKEFIAYDFAHPTRLPERLKGHFDSIICDPPFLSEDCQTKAALTVRWMSKLWQEWTEDSNGRLIVCTGERMESLIHKLYGKARIRTTSFEPKHAKGLSNEFRCYANFDCESWTLNDLEPGTRTQ